MNIAHLKYASEVARTGSVTQAAENLYISQPSLSRAIKELEQDIGIRVFRRTAQGLVPTPEGEEFLVRAEGILSQVADMEALYQKDGARPKQFSVSVPRASYCALAFTRMMSSLSQSDTYEINYKETNALRALRNITQSNYSLGVIRCAAPYEDYFKRLLTEKNLSWEEIWSFEYILLLSRDHPLAQKKEITKEDLSPYPQLLHGDPYVPTLPVSELKKEEDAQSGRRIYIYERGSQFDLLQSVQGLYMWASPVQESLCRRYDLIQRKCRDRVRPMQKDLLVSRERRKPSDLDKLFISELYKARDEAKNINIP